MSTAFALGGSLPRRLSERTAGTTVARDPEGPASTGGSRPYARRTFRDRNNWRAVRKRRHDPAPARAPARHRRCGGSPIGMKIRAAVLEQFGEPLAVTDVDLAEPSAGEALVRLEACGVCHTDMYTASGADPSGYAPTVLGHE